MPGFDRSGHQGKGSATGGGKGACQMHKGQGNTRDVRGGTGAGRCRNMGGAGRGLGGGRTMGGSRQVSDDAEQNMGNEPKPESTMKSGIESELGSVLDAGNETERK